VYLYKKSDYLLIDENNSQIIQVLFAPDNEQKELLAKHFGASINIKKQGLKILSCGSGIESQDKQKQVEALTLVESVKLEAHPIAFGVGG
jgi:phosphate starvation-inducible protein PhoH